MIGLVAPRVACRLMVAELLADGFAGLFVFLLGGLLAGCCWLVGLLPCLLAACSLACWGVGRHCDDSDGGKGGSPAEAIASRLLE